MQDLLQIDDLDDLDRDLSEARELLYLLHI